MQTVILIIPALIGCLASLAGIWSALAVHDRRYLWEEYVEYTFPSMGLTISAFVLWHWTGLYAGFAMYALTFLGVWWDLRGSSTND